MSIKKRQHCIPQCYLKKWTDSNNRLHLCKKSDCSSYEYIGTDTILYENNFYTLTIADCYILTEDDLKYIFGCLEGLTVMCNDEILETRKKLLNNFYLYNNWQIKRNNQYFSEKRKNGLKTNIESKRILRLENFLSEKIENSWPDIVLNIENKIRNSRIIIKKEFLKKEILEFAVILKWRFLSGFATIQEISDMFLKGLFKVNDDLNHDIVILRRNLFLQQLNRYSQGQDCIIASEIQYSLDFQFVFYLSNSKASFITSDNPYFFYIDNGKYGNTFNGAYFPITPEVLLFICKNTDEPHKKYVVRDLAVDDVNTINRIIRDNSYNYIIAKDIEVVEKI